MLVGGTVAAIEPPSGEAQRPSKEAQRPSDAAGPEQGAVDPRADQALRRMGEYLSRAKTLEADATTIEEKVTTDGQKIQEVAQSRVIVKRPGELRVDRVSPRGHAVLVDNGKRFVAYNRDKNVFAMAPAPQKIDAAVDDLRARLQIDAPGGDLLVSDPYHDLIEGTVEGRYIGREPIDGVMTDHLAFTKKDVDWQIWIAEGPNPVPLRYVITTKDMKSQPQFTIELHNWKRDAQVPADTFSITPPSSAKRVELGPQENKSGEQP
jgi:hypothetical protein